ncbi:MAG TPA: hypothetical protein VI759_02730, partial [Dehalococcoidia bacterium]|nr:hypothetical protein [Dehalococcoidia bacterium]
MLRNPDQPGDSHRLMGRVGLRLPSTLLAIEVVAVGLLLVAVALAYLSHSIDMEYFYNSDQLYLPALFRDLLSEGGSYAEWNLTPAPYFFPDWPIYFAGYVVSGGSTYYATLVYALLQLGLTYVLLRAIYGELFEGNRRVYVSLACFGVLVATTLSGVSPIRISLVSARHWGDLLAGLLCIWLCLRILSHPRREGLYVAALGGAAFLAGISDAIHLAHFSLPLLLTAAYLLWRKQIQGRDFLRIGALPVIAAEIGSRLTTAVMPRRHVFKARFGFDDVSENLEEAWRVIERAVAHDPLTLALIPLFYAATIVFIVRYARNREPESLKPNFVTSFAFVSAAVWLGVALFALFVTDARYWAPGFTLPLLLFFAPAAGLAP